jgi:hypothetical protein
MSPFLLLLFFFCHMHCFYLLHVCLSIWKPIPHVRTSLYGLHPISYEQNTKFPFLQGLCSKQIAPCHDLYMSQLHAYIRLHCILYTQCCVPRLNKLHAHGSPNPTQILRFCRGLMKKKKAFSIRY